MTDDEDPTGVRPSTFYVDLPADWDMADEEEDPPTVSFVPEKRGLRRPIAAVLTIAGLLFVVAGVRSCASMNATDVPPATTVRTAK